MNPENNQSKMHVVEVMDGLKKIEPYIVGSVKHPDNNGKAAFHSLILACNVFVDLLDGPLPIIYKTDSMRRVLIAVGSAMDIVRGIQNVQSKKQIKRLRQHLRLIGDGFFGVAGTIINQRQEDDDLKILLLRNGYTEDSSQLSEDASRKTIELMVALACMSYYEDVLLEDTKDSGSKARNPDVIIKDACAVYGIACKSLKTDNANGLVSEIEEAAFQLHCATASRSLKKRKPATAITHKHGVVFVDISARIDHKAIYSPSEPDQCWIRSATGSLLKSEIDRAISVIASKGCPPGGFQAEMNRVFSQYNVSPCVIFYAHTLMLSSDGLGQPEPTYVKVMTIMPFGDCGMVMGFLTKLNQGIHCVRHSIA